MNSVLKLTCARYNNIVQSCIRLEVIYVTLINNYNMISRRQTIFKYFVRLHTKLIFRRCLIFHYFSIDQRTETKPGNTIPKYSVKYIHN